MMEFLLILFIILTLVFLGSTIFFYYGMKFLSSRLKECAEIMSSFREYLIYYKDVIFKFKTRSAVLDENEIAALQEETANFISFIDGNKSQLTVEEFEEETNE
jgi:hypothetical protein